MKFFEQNCQQLIWRNHGETLKITPWGADSLRVQSVPMGEIEDTRYALLEPEMPYELEGFRGSVLFPGSMISEDDGSVKIYYGAADTVECVATAKLDDLLALVTKEGKIG